MYSKESFTMEQTTLNNRYLLEKQLGVGGMAKVYRARDLMLERAVAIKTLRDDFSDDPEFQERFRQEAKSAAKLSHPNIVTVHDFGLSDQTLYIVMEYVPGSDLKSAIKQAGQMEIDETIGLTLQACNGLGYAHRAGVIHCDIKPQNLLITPDNKLKIVDFGIARVLASIQTNETSDIVWGSPNYFSPEQAAGKHPLPASDVYSLGVVLFEMLTGRLPFYADSAEELARKHRESLPPSPRRYNVSIPHRLEIIILKSLPPDIFFYQKWAENLGKILKV
jgi:serine/threonine-protein kinase